MLSPVDVRTEQVPIFNILAVETGSMCNRHCVFCPNHENNREEDWLPINLIEKMVAELALLNWRGQFMNYIYNEPLRDKRCRTILQLVSKHVPRACLSMSTNGDYLHSRDNLAALYAAGVRQLVINIYSAADGTGKNEAAGVRLARARAALIDKWARELKLTRTPKVYEWAPPGTRNVSIEHKYGITRGSEKLARFELQNRSGNIAWFVPVIKQPFAKMCVRPWRILNINYRGDAILCCNDYNGETAMGNIKSKSLVDLWNGPMMNKYRLFLQNKRRDTPLCDKCDYTGGAYPHMIHPVTFGKGEDENTLRNPRWG